MNLAIEFADCSLEQLKASLDGGTLNVYSVARPTTADHAVERSTLLASFKFATPAFAAASDGLEKPIFAANPVAADGVGTPGFARAHRADGTVVADFSAGPGDREVKFLEVSCSSGAPVTLTSFRFMPEGGWPEKPEYYDTRPRSAFTLPNSP